MKWLKRLLGLTTVVDRALEIDKSVISRENIELTMKALIELERQWADYSIPSGRMFYLDMYTDSFEILKTDIEYTLLIVESGHYIGTNWTGRRFVLNEYTLDNFLTDNNSTAWPADFLPEYLHAIQEILHNVYDNPLLDKMRNYYIRKFEAVFADILTLNISLITVLSAGK